LSGMARTAPLVIDWSIPANPRTGARTPTRNPVSPYRRQRIEDPSLEQLTRIVAAIQDESEAVTTAARALPDAGTVVIYKNVRFGGTTVLEHRIGVGNNVTTPSTSMAAPVAAFADQIHYQLFNQVGGNALVYRTAIDDRTITLFSDAIFTASVRLFVLP
jgi:hypothetical protein